MLGPHTSLSSASSGPVAMEGEDSEGPGQALLLSAVSLTVQWPLESLWGCTGEKTGYPDCQLVPLWGARFEDLGKLTCQCPGRSSMSCRLCAKCVTVAPPGGVTTPQV